MAINVILKITKPVFGIKRTLFLYRLIQLLTLPLAAFYFAFRWAANRSYRPHFWERLGFFSPRLKPTAHGSIWLHAVSVGEVTSAVPLIEKLRLERPQVCIYVSTSTVAGRKAAKRHLTESTAGIFYSPLDYVSCVRRTLRAIRPALVIVLETEIWPNLYAESKRFGARLAIVNGRISNKTWPRYHAAKHFFAPVLALADVVLVQSDEDRNRYLQLGVAPEKLAAPGNLKYDATRSAKNSELPVFGATHVWIAASTVGPNERGSSKRHKIDEDDLVLDGFAALVKDFPRLLLILAPRQPARFDVVAAKLQGRNLNYLRRTSLKQNPLETLQLPGVLLLDTIGELSAAFSLAHVAFVGGSIAPRGGHNILEPAAAGVPVVVGPYMQNFASIVRDFAAAQAIVQVRQSDDLCPAIRHLLIDREYAAELGRRARQVIEQRRGVCDRVAAHLLALYYQSNPTRLRGPAARPFLAPFAFLWKHGGVIKRRRAEVAAKHLSPLPAPVISVGGITVGGSGKTPLVNYLAGRLRQRGYAPAILTRGYRRRSSAERLVLAPGSHVPPALTGDEAQIFLRSGTAVVGIGANRYKTAQLVLTEFPDTDVFLLDDGFQHARLARDFDVVVIDGLDPFGGGELVPLGRLREPLSALKRADAFVVTRVEDDDHRYQVLRQRLQEYKPNAPVFRTRLVARRWRDHRSGAVLNDLRARRVGAFCGLGNPQNFWNTLRALGLEIVFRWEFEDHHFYKPLELQRVAHHALAKGAEILVTTEKDRMNCPDHLERAIAPLELAWLEIELELEEEARFFTMLEGVLRKQQGAA